MSSPSRDYRIYALYLTTPDGSRQYFYVGKTRRAIAARVREHVNRTSRGHEDLYVHLRALAAAGADWACEELRVCDAQYEPDVERFEVVRLLRLGHDLCNMRYGDAGHRAELIRLRDDPAIRSAADVRRARLDATSRAELRRAVKARGRLRRRALADLLRDTGIPSTRACALLRGVLVRRLTRHGDVTIERTVSLAQLIQHARGAHDWDRLERFKRTVETSHPPVWRVSPSR